MPDFFDDILGPAPTQAAPDFFSDILGPVQPAPLAEVSPTDPFAAAFAPIPEAETAPPQQLTPETGVVAGELPPTAPVAPIAEPEAPVPAPQEDFFGDILGPREAGDDFFADILGPREPSALERVGGVAGQIGREIVGGVEAAAATAGGFLEFPGAGIPAGIAGLTSLIGRGEGFDERADIETVIMGSPLGATLAGFKEQGINIERASDTIQSVQESLHPFFVYQPRTEEGQRAQERITSFLDFLISTPARTAGELAESAVTPLAGPTAGAISGAGLNILSELGGFAVLLGGAKTKLGRKVANKEPLTIKEAVEFEKTVVETANKVETELPKVRQRFIDQSKEIQGERLKLMEEAARTVFKDPVPPERVVEPIPGLAPEPPAAGGLPFEADLPKFAGTINLERIGAPKDVKRLILDTADNFKGQIEGFRRGKIALEETKAMADKLGMTPETLMKRKEGQALNAEQATAANSILDASARITQAAAVDAVASGSDAALIKFRKTMARHALIQAEAAGVRAEAGRALSAFRIVSQPTKNLNAVLDALGGRELSESVLEMFTRIDPTDQIAVNSFIRNITKARTSDMIFEAWVNALLSSPTTHVVNTTSNALTFLSKIPEESLAASIDFARARVTDTPRERFFGEAPQHVYGLWDGIKEGTRKGIQSYITEIPSYITEIPSQGISKLETVKMQAIPGPAGKIVRIPGRALIAMDEFFKAINFEAELRSEAYRIASMEGKKGEARAERMAEIMQNPPKEVLERSQQEMLYRVFQKELGPFGKTVQKARVLDPTGILKYIVPFVRTPTNIAKFGLERTPLYFPLIAKRVLTKELKGGAIADELAKATMGSSIAATVAIMSKEGNITGGGPKDRERRDSLFRTGWKPYSVRIGDEYFSYGRLEPLGTTMGLTADFIELFDTMSEGEASDVAAKLGMAVAQNVTNKTFMQGLSNALNAISDPARYGSTWTERFVGTAIPRGVASLARAQDPILRDPQNFKEVFKAQIPYLSVDVLPRRDLWGEPVRRPTEGVEALVSPVARSPIKADKLNNEMVRLEVDIAMPRAEIVGIKLTAKEYDELIARAGRKARRRLEARVRARDWDKQSDVTKRRTIESEITAHRDAIREKLEKRIRHRARQEQSTILQRNGGRVVFSPSANGRPGR